MRKLSHATFTSWWTKRFMKLAAPRVIEAGSVLVGPEASGIHADPFQNDVTAVSPSRCSRSEPAASAVDTEVKFSGIHELYCSPHACSRGWP